MNLLRGWITTGLSFVQQFSRYFCVNVKMRLSRTEHVWTKLNTHMCILNTFFTVVSKKTCYWSKIVILIDLVNWAFTAWFFPCCLILKDGSRFGYPDVLTAVMAAGGLRSSSWTPAVTGGDLAALTAPGTQR